MSYYLTITKCNLQYANPNRPPIDLKDLYHSWYYDNGHICPENDYIKWSDDLINDFLFMIEHSIRGTIKVRGEEEELTLFKLTEEGVEESFGHTTYSEKPDVIYKVGWQ